MAQSFTADLQNNLFTSMWRAHAPQTPHPMLGGAWKYKFVRRNEKRYAGKPAPIRLQIFLGNDQRTRISLGFSVMAKDWDAENQRVRGKSKTALSLNEIIRTHLMKVLDLFRFYIQNDITPTKTRFERDYLNESSHEDFIAWSRKYIADEKQRGLIAAATWKKYNSALNVFESFKREVSFDSITHDLIVDFEQWQKRRGNTLNTVAKNMQALKKCVNAAKKLKVLKTDPFEGYSVKFVASQREAIMPEELNLLLDLFFNKQIETCLKDTLQCFLFSCFTGLRPGDLSRINRSNIINNVLVYTPSKTAKHETFVQIPLSKIVHEIINPTGPLFNKVTENQTMNKNLKVIMRMAGINKWLTYYVSRNTFACLYLHFRNDTGGQALIDLMHLMGHAKIETTMIYVRIVEAWQRKGIDNFDKYFDQYLPGE
ncbi:MAG: site-specific integrase [Pseudoalteromonas tetraodonis]